jgi:hypothetical protein
MKLLCAGRKISPFLKGVAAFLFLRRGDLPFVFHLASLEFKILYHTKRKKPHVYSL